MLGDTIPKHIAKKLAAKRVDTGEGEKEKEKDKEKKRKDKSGKGEKVATIDVCRSVYQGNI
jgi:hypothetical protein